MSNQVAVSLLLKKKEKPYLIIIMLIYDFGISNLGVVSSVCRGQGTR